jgi:predicted site-specific integrase-resolvase
MTVYLTTAQVCARAGITRQWLHEHHLKNGYLKPAPIEGARGHRFREDAVNRWLSAYYPQRLKETALQSA